MATVDEEFRRQYRDVAPFNPTSGDRAHNTQQFIIFLQKMSQVQPLLRVLVQATRAPATPAPPQENHYPKRAPLGPPRRPLHTPACGGGADDPIPPASSPRIPIPRILLLLNLASNACAMVHLIWVMLPQRYYL